MSVEPAPTPPRPLNRGAGRPRNPELEQRLKRVALETLAEHGFSGLTLEKVCTRAKIPRATFYRRWATPEALVSDAFNERFETGVLESTGDLARDLELFAGKLVARPLHRLAARRRSRRQTGQVRGLWSRSSADLLRHDRPSPAGRGHAGRSGHLRRAKDGRAFPHDEIVMFDNENVVASAPKVEVRGQRLLSRRLMLPMALLGDVELYDLSADPTDSYSVAATYPDVAKDMHARFVKAQAEFKPFRHAEIPPVFKAMRQALEHMQD